MTERQSRNGAIPPELWGRTEQLTHDAQALVSDAFAKGVEHVVDQLGAFCRDLERELERHYNSLTPEDANTLEAGYAGTGVLPTVNAHFGASAAVVACVKGELLRLGRAERA